MTDCTCPPTTTGLPLAHLHGCPVVERRTCRWCGTSFKPSSKGQGFCTNDCRDYFNGYATDPDRRTADDDSN